MGASVGILTSLMGVGGGFIMVPAMIYLLKLPTKIAVGTSLFQLLFTTAAVSIMQAGVNHSVDPFLALILILGSVLGTKLGAQTRGAFAGGKAASHPRAGGGRRGGEDDRNVAVPRSEIYDMTVDLRR